MHDPDPLQERSCHRGVALQEGQAQVVRAVCQLRCVVVVPQQRDQRQLQGWWSRELVEAPGVYQSTCIRS